MALHEPKPHESSETLHPNQNQIARLYTIAKDRGWNTAGVHRLIEANFRVYSTKELTLRQYEQVVQFLETSIVPNVTTMGRDPNTIDMFGQS